MTIPAGKFKAECLKLMDQVNETHVSLTITKRGRPVARLVPATPEKPTGFFGYLKGLSHGSGDIIEPVDEKWDAENGE